MFLSVFFFFSSFPLASHWVRPRLCPAATAAMSRLALMMRPMAVMQVSQGEGRGPHPHSDASRLGSPYIPFPPSVGLFCCGLFSRLKGCLVWPTASTLWGLLVVNVKTKQWNICLLKTQVPGPCFGWVCFRSACITVCFFSALEDGNVSLFCDWICLNKLSIFCFTFCVWVCVILEWKTSSLVCTMCVWDGHFRSHFKGWLSCWQLVQWFCCWF